MKISIIGYSGAGKSTTCRSLADFYDISFLHLDTVQFLPNWVTRDVSDGLKIVDEFMENTSWVIDGNYENYRQKERFEQADKIVFLNFNRFSCLIRAYKRLFKYKNTSRESMAKGCNEKIDREFFWWLVHEGRKKSKRDKYKELSQKYKEKFVLIKNQKELNAFLDKEKSNAI
ncbi:MAG: DNA topology modulation protein FlaR [Clostridia bacterium]